MRLLFGSALSASGYEGLILYHRANGYYSSFTYFASKILFDILPLRIIPPIVFGGIIYAWIGLVPEVATFWKFMLTLVLVLAIARVVGLWLFSHFT